MRGAKVGAVAAAAIVLGGCASGSHSSSSSGPPSRTAAHQQSASTTGHAHSPAVAGDRRSASAPNSAHAGFSGWSKDGIGSALVRPSHVDHVSGYAPGGRPTAKITEREDVGAAQQQNHRCREQRKAYADASTDYLSATASYVTRGEPLPSVTVTVSAWPSRHARHAVTSKGKALDACLGRRGNTKVHTVHGLRVTYVRAKKSATGWGTARFGLGGTSVTVLCEATDKASAKACRTSVAAAVDKLKRSQPH